MPHLYLSRLILLILAIFASTSGAASDQDTVRTLESARGDFVRVSLLPGKYSGTSICVISSGASLHLKFDIRAGPPRFTTGNCACVSATRHNIRFWDKAAYPVLRADLDLTARHGRMLVLIWSPPGTNAGPVSYFGPSPCDVPQP